MKLIAKNGKILKEGSRVIDTAGEACYIYKIDRCDIGIECMESGVSYDGVDPESLGALWDEADFVDFFFKTREEMLEAGVYFQN